MKYLGFLLSTCLLFCVVAIDSRATSANEVTPGQVDAIVTASRPLPFRVHLAMDDNRSMPIPIANDADVFSGPVSLPSGASPSPTSTAFENGELIAEYSDGGRETLPIRLYPGLTALDLGVERKSPLVCSEPTVEAIEKASTTDYPAMLAAYFDARDLNHLQPPADPCYSIMSKRVAAAWFYWSYELATLKHYIRLDPDAVTAARSIKGDRYVDQRISQLDALDVKVLNDASTQFAQRGGDVHSAITAKDHLISRLESDNKLRHDTLQFQGLTVKVLQDQRAVLLRRLAASPNA